MTYYVEKNTNPHLPRWRDYLRQRNWPLAPWTRVEEKV